MRDQGSVTVELALLVPLILLLAAMVIEAAVVARTQIELVAAAREGVRVAATTPDPAVALEAVKRVLGSRGDEARVNVHRPHVVGAEARVSISLPFRVDLPLLGGPTIPLSASAAMRVEQ